MSKIRDVKIVLETYPKWRAYAVKYVARVKGQRYNAATFDAAHSSLTEVKTWINKNTKLRLID